MGSFYRATASTALQQGRNKKNSVSIAGVRPPKHRLLSLTHTILTTIIALAVMSRRQKSADIKAAQTGGKKSIHLKTCVLVLCRLVVAAVCLVNLL